MEHKKSGKSILDEDTGEIVQELFEGDRIVTGKTIDFLHNYDLNFNKDKRFVKVFDESIPILRNELTPQEIVLTFSLIPFVCYNDCIIRMCPDDRGKILNLKELSECLNYDYAVLRRLMASLKKKGVVAKVEVGSIIKNDNYSSRDIWIVNPYIFFRGDHVNRTVTGIFEKTKWDEHIQYNRE